MKYPGFLRPIIDQAESGGAWTSIVNILTADGEGFEDFEPREVATTVGDDLRSLASEALEYLGLVEAAYASPVLVCQNCGKEYPDASALVHAWPDIPKLTERVQPGERIPAGECNECGALVHTKEAT